MMVMAVSDWPVVEALEAAGFRPSCGLLLRS
jgi:hypothetical protein